jgi:hypothetical protein
MDAPAPGDPDHYLWLTPLLFWPAAGRAWDTGKHAYAAAIAAVTITSTLHHASYGCAADFCANRERRVMRHVDLAAVTAVAAFTVWHATPRTRPLVAPMLGVAAWTWAAEHHMAWTLRVGHTSRCTSQRPLPCGSPRVDRPG